MHVIADTRKTSAMLKKYLRELHGINFSVKTDKYSGGSSLRVEYILGPDATKVEKVIALLQYGDFDGMDDSYNYRDSNEYGLKIGNFQLETFKYTFVKQVIPDEFKFLLAKMLCDEVNFKDVPKLERPEQLYHDFPEPMFGAWNWGNLLHRNFRRRDFVTDKWQELILMGCKADDNTPFNFTFEYEFRGKIYTTV